MLLPFLIVAAAGVVALWFAWRQTVKVPCELDLEATHDHFHAHVKLEGVAVEPGDAVQVERAPTAIPFGEKRTLRSEARVGRASWIRRKWTRLVGSLQFRDLYDVGFE